MSFSRESTLGASIFLAIIIYLAYSIGFFDVDRLARGSGNLFIFAADLFPPDFSVAETLLYSILETIQMALLGTVLGFMAALPLGLMGARNVSGRSISALVRLLLGAIRTIPALLWAIIFVVAFGLGPLSGTLGLAVY